MTNKIQSSRICFRVLRLGRVEHGRAVAGCCKNGLLSYRVILKIAVAKSVILILCHSV